jgi:hypothetical protein
VDPVIVSKPVERPSALEWGVASMPLSGETQSGDAHLVCNNGDGGMVAVIDGLGHGEGARTAARRAMGVLAEHSHAPVIPLVRRCHEALRGTRGVVMSLATFNVADGTMSWIGIGNVTGVLWRADPRTSPRQEIVLARGGVVGLRLPPLQATVTAIATGDLLVFATDGIQPGFRDLLETPDSSPQHLADRILAGYGKGTDDALVLVARYRGSGASTP